MPARRITLMDDCCWGPLPVRLRAEHPCVPCPGRDRLSQVSADSVRGRRDTVETVLKRIVDGVATSRSSVRDDAEMDDRRAKDVRVPSY
jgi:hypothetical protein